MDVAVLVFDGVSALDAVGPYEVLVRLPGARMNVVGVRRGEVRTETGALGLTVDRTLDELTEPHVLVVPGGPGSFAAAADPDLLGWLRHAHAHAARTLTVCSGSVLLAATGALAGQRVATSWHVRDQLARFGAGFAGERIAQVGGTRTAAGAATGLDAALLLVADLAGEDVARAIQLGLEYAPEPPFDSGDPAVASAELTALCGRVGLAATAPRWARLLGAGPPAGG